MIDHDNALEFPESKDENGNPRWVVSPFYEFYKSHLGYRMIGLPLSGMKPGPDPSNNILEQDFEHVRLEHHPENAGTEYEIQVGLTNSELIWITTFLSEDLKRRAREQAHGMRVGRLPPKT